MKNLIFFIFLIIIVGSCRPNLDFARQNLIKDPFRMDGFYFSEQKYTHFFFYKNGIVAGGFGFLDGSVDVVKNYYSKINVVKYLRKDPDHWGVFNIENKKYIKVSKWVSKEWAQYEKISFRGEVLNDTTITLNFPPSGGTVVFHFHAMPSRPDSTNNFIK
jgi:hypothetical protein